jgi:hypothetical protein
MNRMDCCNLCMAFNTIPHPLAEDSHLPIREGKQKDTHFIPWHLIGSTRWQRRQASLLSLLLSSLSVLEASQSSRSLPQARIWFPVGSMDVGH